MPSARPFGLMSRDAKIAAVAGRMPAKAFPANLRRTKINQPRPLLRVRLREPLEA